MMQPVRCLRCGGIYDLVGVGVVDRYADCTVWITPCCKQKVNDSKTLMSTFPYEDVTLNDIEKGLIETIKVL